MQDVAPGSAVTGIACPSASLCVAVDRAGDIITSVDPTGGAGAWRLGYLDPASTAVGTGFTSVACPSASLCVAGDVAGNLFFTANPADGAGAWSASHIDSAQMQCGEGKYEPIYCQATIAGLDCPSASTCLALDGAGNVLTSSAPGGGVSAWRVTGTPNATSLSCPSTTVCFAPGDGTIILSTDSFGDPSSWTQTAVFDGTPELTAVSCSRAMCAVGDASGHVLTSLAPTAGPASWTSTYIGPWGFQDLSCPSANFCAGVSFSGEVMASDDPSTPDPTWVETNLGMAGLFTISCPSASLCVAADYRGQIATSSNPTGGTATWTVRTVDSAERPTALSCPSASLCLMSLDGDGQVASTTDPTGPASAWRVASVDHARSIGGLAAMLGVSCPTVSLCVATDNAGHVIVSTDPRNSRARWTSHDVNQQYSVGQIDCPSATLCVASIASQLLSTADPTGPGRWQIAQLGSQGANWVSALSCQSTILCLAVSGPNAFFGTPAPPPSSAQIAAAMRPQLVPATRARKTKSLLKAHSLTTSATSLSAGTWRVTWYAGNRSIASGNTRFPAAGTKTLKLRLTAAGQRLLARLLSLRIRATGTFTTAAAHATTTTVMRSFTLRR